MVQLISFRSHVSKKKRKSYQVKDQRNAKMVILILKRCFIYYQLNQCYKNLFYKSKNLKENFEKYNCFINWKLIKTKQKRKKEKNKCLVRKIDIDNRINFLVYKIWGASGKHGCRNQSNSAFKLVSPNYIDQKKKRCIS